MSHRFVARVDCAHTTREQILEPRSSHAPPHLATAHPHRRPVRCVRSCRDPGHRSGRQMEDRVVRPDPRDEGPPRALHVEAGEGSTVQCTGACAKTWPPLTIPHGTMAAKHIAGIMGTFGEIMRPDGQTQVTFDGHPLYTFHGDTPTKILCNGVDGWFVVQGALAGVESGEAQDLRPPRLPRRDRPRPHLARLGTSRPGTRSSAADACAAVGHRPPAGGSTPSRRSMPRSTRRRGG